MEPFVRQQTVFNGFHTGGQLHLMQEKKKKKVSQEILDYRKEQTTLRKEHIERLGLVPRKHIEAPTGYNPDVAERVLRSVDSLTNHKLNYYGHNSSIHEFLHGRHGSQATVMSHSHILTSHDGHMDGHSTILKRLQSASIEAIGDRNRAPARRARRRVRVSRPTGGRDVLEVRCDEDQL
eukprot:TRINITY_DN11309_c0_g1_i3.p1 TRINITY_DN11309_c0_g1~~TRINITY_DN11309_c0_g1_i3.p1  ORF type:complete len:179 (+),score=12.90 TRINITY_DN11309_c0_g1_i3:170-706(+)